MIKLNNLPKITTRGKKRIGRGYGSGKGGHTVGRGTKGQKSRGKVKLTFGGTKIKKDWIKRLPMRRGRGYFSKEIKPKIFNVGDLEKYFAKNEKVSLAAMLAKKIIRRSETKEGVKILGKGEIKIPLEVILPCSKKAKEKILKAGGKTQNVKSG